MSDVRITGGCQCGAVRYAVHETPYQIGITSDEGFVLVVIVPVDRSSNLDEYLIRTLFYSGK